jgi:putative phosphoesterase
MIIGILSDTHIPARAKALPAIVLEHLSRADHIIHAGDINALDVLDVLEKLAPVTAVAGNTDEPETKRRLPEIVTVTLGGKRFGVFHGHGSGRTTLLRVIGGFQNQEPDCIVFGHSHQPYCRFHGNTLLLNPGSPTDKRRNPLYSFAVLDIALTLEPRLIFFDHTGIVRIAGAN